MQLNELSIQEAHALLKSKEITSQELTRALLDRIETLDSNIGAFITVAADLALEQARKADAAIAAGTCAPLTGIPIGVKDVLCTEQIRTTCGSAILKNFIPPYDATVIDKLKRQNAVILGKTNMDEFAMGSTNENSGFRPVSNPWDLSRIPGGSSGGSAAAVAARMCIGALGSDTGGSIRQPASHCSVVGLKPTYGRVSRFGLVAFASSLDQIGPITSSVADSALLLSAISGYDPADSTSVPDSVPDYSRALAAGLDGTKIGIPREFFEVEGLDPDVAAAVQEGLAVFKDQGAECIDVSLPYTPYVVAAYYVIAPSEASSNLARYDGVKYGFRDDDTTDLMEMYRQTRSKGFGPEVQRRIIIGTYCLSAGYYDAYYKKASQVRTLITDSFRSAFQQCDVIVSPVAPTPAFEKGAHSDDPLAMYLSDIFTLSANLAGIPGISVPCGFSRNGLPIGLQLMGGHMEEAKILKAAFNFEQATDHHRRRPQI